jgi:hypothetical protein
MTFHDIKYQHYIIDKLDPYRDRAHRRHKSSFIFSYISTRHHLEISIILYYKHTSSSWKHMNILHYKRWIKSNAQCVYSSIVYILFTDAVLLSKYNKRKYEHDSKASSACSFKHPTFIVPYIFPVSLHLHHLFFICFESCAPLFDACLCIFFCYSSTHTSNNNTTN